MAASSFQYQALILNDNSRCQSMERTRNKSPTLELPNYTLEAGGAAERGIRQLPSRRPLAPSMLTDGPPDTAESFILVQQIHSRGLQGPRALSSAVQGWSCGAAGGRSAGSESAMCLLQQLYSPRPTLCTTMHTGTSPSRNIPMM